MEKLTLPVNTGEEVSEKKIKSIAKKVETIPDTATLPLQRARCITQRPLLCAALAVVRRRH